MLAAVLIVLVRAIGVLYLHTHRDYCTEKGKKYTSLICHDAIADANGENLAKIQSTVMV